MPHLVRAHLPHAREYEVRVGRGRVRAHQAGVEVVIGSRAMRIQPRHALDDLTRTWIGHGTPDRPSALVTILPLHHVVARVHWIHALRQELDPESAAQTRTGEGVFPPAHPLERRRP